MCGIAVLVALQGARIAPALCTQFGDRLAHRGPDAAGIATFARDGSPSGPDDAAVALIHRRLSIIDLDARSNQPLMSADHRYMLTYNGEIYNYIELRDELAAFGHVFHTTSDSEVLIAAIAQWGDAALSRLTGMFAFALLDRTRRELLLARDPFGIKPLFWATGHENIAIASEVGPLLDVPGVGRAIDHQRVCLFLGAGQTDEAERTMFGNVRSLPAGSFARISLDQPSAPVATRYWKPTVAPRERPAGQAVAEVRKALIESVQLHLRSDVPTGIALSGGIDSSAILGCARLVGGSSLDLRTFSFVATGSEVDETPYIELAAQSSNAEMSFVRIEPEEIIQDIGNLIQVQGEPFGSLSMYAQNRVMRLARDNGIKVILEGQGADELFAGYRPYLARRLSQLMGRRRWADAFRFMGEMRRLPGAGRSLVAQAFEPLIAPQWRGFARMLVGRPLLPPWIDARWFIERGHFAMGRGLRRSPNLLHDALAQSLTETVLPSLLRYGDRNSMAYSIESRVPFLTAPLADLAYSLSPDDLIDRNAQSKSVLRAAMRGIVPDAILDRRDKVAFSTPDRMWASALHPWFVATLTSETARSLPWLKADIALKQLERRISNSSGFGFDLWRTINVVRWIEQFNVDAG